MKNRIKLILVALLAVVAFTGCPWDDPDRGFQDVSVEPASLQNSVPPHMINFPDKFMNVAFKCNGVDGVYSHTREASPVIVPNDPECTKKPGG